MSIYREFEEFVKRSGEKIDEQRTQGGLKTVWEIGSRVVVIDEEPDREDQRIVMVVLEAEEGEVIEYLSPASVLGGALEQFSISVSPERISSPSQLRLILGEMRREAE